MSHTDRIQWTLADKIAVALARLIRGKATKRRKTKQPGT